VPDKYEQEIYIEPGIGVMRPNENQHLSFTFIPYRKKDYKIKVPVVFREIENTE
jgi:hypothetical protein